MPENNSSDKMRKAEKEIGDNIPQEMIGLDSEDSADVEDPTPDPPRATGPKGTAEDADKAP